MRAFASVALLGLVASATAVADGYHRSHGQLYAHQPKAVDHTHYDDGHKHHHHTQPVTHVDVWETIKADITALQDAILDQQNACDASTNTIGDLESAYNDLLLSLATKEGEALGASTGIAQQNIIDNTQNMMLTQLNDSITSAEADVRELENMATLLEMIIGNLPDFQDLVDRLGAIEVKNGTLAGVADDNATELERVQGLITTANGLLVEANDDLMASETAKDGLTNSDPTMGSIAKNTADIGDTKDAIETLQMAFDRQKIVSDYFFTNDAVIEVPDGTVVCQTELICVPDMHTIDFQLAATTQPSVDINTMMTTGAGEIHTITLQDESNLIVASSQQEVGAPIRGRPHTLLWRATNMSGGSQSYKVCFEGIAQGADDTVPSIQPKNLQISTRLYESTTLLATVPTITC